MTNSLRQDFHSDLAIAISNEIQYKRSNYYYFLGKIEPWGVNDTAPITIQPDSELENSLIRTNAIFMRRITPNDVSLVTNRYNWESGTVFSTWDHTKNMKLEKFYCVTADNNVYKCLDNGGNAVSTVAPSGKSFFVIRTSDGYLWKYMYTVPSFKRSRFMSYTNLPVQRSLTDSFYNKGAVDAITIANGGSGYSDSLLTTITVTGTTSGTGGVGTVVCGPTGNITSVVITNGGTGYTHGVNVAFNSVAGTGAIGTAVISSGVITGITFSSGGIGYVTGESIVFSVGGAIVIPSVSRNTGSISSVKIVKGGAGYASVPTLTVVGAGGTGKYDNACALVSGVLYRGSLVRANIVDPGISYPSDNATTIVTQGDGVDAVFSPVIYNGEIVDVVVENSGSGYTSMNLTVVGAGTGAAINAIISASDFSSDQSIVEQTTTIGAIYSIIVVNGGTNYSAATVVDIIGDGAGCTATPVLSNGTITHVIVNTFGSDYTYATITFTDPLRSTLGNLVDASAYAILPPSKGHGYDAVNELFGDTLAINSSLRQDVKLNHLMQDYRQFGLIKNPTNILTGKSLTEESSMLTYEVVFANTGGLVIDEILIQNNVKFRVVLVVGNTVFLQQLGIKYVNPIGTFYSETEMTRIYVSNSVVTYPTANKYSGNLLYVSDENPFTFNQEQGIIIKTFLKF
jgi:hypothetical protein